MIEFLHGLAVLAQNGNGKNGEAPPPLTNPFIWLFPALLILIIFQFMFGPHRREQKRKDELLKSLKKNDRVVTIGGIYGTVASIAAEKNEVTLKVDDNTRLKMTLDSIRTVLRDEEKEPVKP
jgi:preprotein translocase subunit YajC